MRLGRFLFVLFGCLLWVASPVFAQLELDEIYEASDDALEFLYPSDWEVNDDSYEDLGIITLTGDIGRDSIVMTFISPSFLALLAPRARDVDDIVEAMTDIFDISNDENIDFNGREAVIANFENDSSSGITLILEFEEGDFGAVLIFAFPADALDDEEVLATVISIVASYNNLGSNELGTSFSGNNLGGILGGGTNSGEDDSLPTSLNDFDGDWRDTIAELVDEGVIGSGGALILAENLVFGDASSPGYVPIGSRTSRRDVVVAGEIDFPDSRNDALCGISARNNSSTSLVLALSGSGELLIADLASDDFYSENLRLDMDEPHHLLFIAQAEELTVYVDGELIFERVAIGDDTGSFTLFMDPDGVRVRCDIRNFWAYEAPIVIEGLCEAFAGGTVNKRSGPGTSFDRAGTMSAGQRLEVIGQAESSDGFVWYELEDDSWVREDIVTLQGDCTNIPESE